MSLSDPLVALGSFLGSIAFGWEMIRQMASWLIKPNFHVSMKSMPYDGGYNAHIYIENPKNKWFVGNATECRVFLKVLDSVSGQELKGTTPLRWEQTGNDYNPRIPAGSSTFDLFALRHDPRTNKLYVNVCQGSNSNLSRLRVPQDHKSIDIQVTIESKEKTITGHVGPVEIREQFPLDGWPPFEIDC